MAQTDLFVWLDALWNKSAPEGIPPIRMMHRFLASDKDFAPFCREFQLRVRDPALVFRIWQGLLPKGRGAPDRPRLQYTGAKKPPAEEALVARMRAVLAERREIVEQMIDVLKAAKRLPELYAHFGLEEPDDDAGQS